MVYQKYITTLLEVIPYEENKRKDITLPKDVYITKLLLELKLNITTGSSPSFKQDWIWRIIKELTIRSPKFPFARFTDGRLLKVKMILDYAGKNIVEPTPPEGGTTTDVKLKIELHFGFNKKDPFDPSVCIPAPLVSETKLEVLWGNDSDLGSGITINSGEIKVTVYGISQSTPPFGYYIPAYQSYPLTVSGAVTEYGRLYHKIEGYGILKNIYILELNSSDNRVDGLITNMRVAIPEYRHYPIDVEDEAWKRDVAREYNIDEDLLVGIRAFEPRRVWGVDLDLDKLKKMPYSIYLEYKTSTAGEVLHFYDAYQRPEEVLR